MDGIRVSPALRRYTEAELLGFVRDGYVFLQGDTLVPVISGGMPAPPLANSFDGGSDGVLITAANSGGASGDAFTSVADASSQLKYSTLWSHSGSVSQRILQGATPASTNARWSGYGALAIDVYHRCYVRIPAIPATGQFVFLGLRQTTGGALSAEFFIDTAGHIGVNTAGGLGIAALAGTVAVTAGSVWRFEVRAKASATVGEIEHFLYTTADAPLGSHIETKSSAVQNLGATIDESRWGQVTNTIANFESFIDDPAVSTVGYLGPTGAPVIPLVFLPAPLLVTLNPLARFQIALPWRPPPAAPVTVQTAVVGLATETDLASALLTAKTQAVAPALETDVAQVVNVRPIKVPVGLASELDSAFAPGSLSARIVGLASEADSAFALGSLSARAIGLASATATAFALGRVSTLAVGLASEVDTALQIGRLKREAIGLAVETDSAIALGRLSARVVALASELDSAFAVGRKKAKVVGLASELDSALTVGAPGVKTITIAVETDSAFALGRLTTKPVALASELDSAFAVGRLSRLQVGVASELDVALALRAAKRRALGQAVEVDVAAALGRTSLRVVGLASELDLAFVIVAVGGLTIVIIETADRRTRYVLRVEDHRSRYRLHEADRRTP